ncbi:spore maturation protein A [Anaerobutyricum hallii]|nr:spore maturation protein A [Anaerobutyricum hallii]
MREFEWFMLNILWVIMIAGGIFFAAFHGTMGQITESFISSSTEAVNLCIFMLGVIGVWNGMMEIAVKSGLMKKIAKTMYPFIHWLFPDIPPRHKANEYIAANMAANILGLGWAATPAGLKAMRELQKLEEGGGRASDMMCAFLVLNISSLQLVPINMIAYRSQYGSVNPAAVVLPAICATMISTIAGIVFIKIMEITRYNGKKYNRKNKKKRRWIQ